MKKGAGVSQRKDPKSQRRLLPVEGECQEQRQRIDGVAQALAVHRPSTQNVSSRGVS